jgi:hypothetical protein
LSSTNNASSLSRLSFSNRNSWRDAKVTKGPFEGSAILTFGDKSVMVRNYGSSKGGVRNFEFEGDSSESAEVVLGKSIAIASQIMPERFPEPLEGVHDPLN